MFRKTLPFLLAMSIFLTGCVYKVNIEQGNIVTPDMVSKLKMGMNQEQVEFIMGHPILTETFSDHRWDYVYTFRADGKDKTYKRLTLHFDGDILTSMDSVGIQSTPASAQNVISSDDEQKEKLAPQAPAPAQGQQPKPQSTNGSVETMQFTPRVNAVGE